MFQFKKSALNVICLSALSELEVVKSQWRELEARSNAPLTWFQTHDWCSNWLHNHGELYKNPAIFCLFSDGHLIAVWPLMVQSNALGIKTLRSLGEPHTQYSNILTENGTLSREEAQALKAAVFSLQGVDCSLLDLIPAQSPIASVMGTGARTIHNSNQSAYFDLTKFASIADYEKTLSKSTRRGRARRRKALEELGTVSIRVLQPGDPDFAALVQKSLRFKDVWLRKMGKVGEGIRAKGHDTFLAALPRLEGQEGAFLFSLEINGTPIAIEIGFLRKGHFYAYIGSFNWAYYDASPGKILMQHVIHWLIDRGAKAYDLLANPTDYKTSWTDTTVELNTVACDFTLAGKAYSTLWSRSTKLIMKRSFEKLPDGLRSGLVLMRKLDIKFVV